MLKEVREEPGYIEVFTGKKERERESGTPKITTNHEKKKKKKTDISMNNFSAFLCMERGKRLGLFKS